MRRILVLALALLAALFPLLAATAQTRTLTLEEEFILQELSDHNSAIRTMAGRFLQIDSQGGRVEGTFYVSRPNMVRFRYAPPSREEIISQGRGFYVIDRVAQTQQVYAQEHVPLRQFLGDRVSLINANLTDVVMSESHVAVMLSDDSPIGVVQVSLIFERDSKDLVQWSLIEPSGVETTFSIYDVEKNIDIPAHYFTINAGFTTISE